MASTRLRAAAVVEMEARLADRMGQADAPQWRRAPFAALRQSVRATIRQAFCAGVQFSSENSGEVIPRSPLGSAIGARLEFVDQQRGGDQGTTPLARFDAAMV